LIKISKDEAKMVRFVFNGVASIHRTCKQKSDRHNYYAEESAAVRHAVEEYRQGISLERLKAKYRNAKVGTFY